MKQTTRSAGSFDRYSKTTRRAAFLAEMDRMVSWSALCALTEPVYPDAGNGRPPVGLKRMLRIYFLQNWFNLSESGAIQTCLPGHQAHLWLCQSQLSRHDEERQSPVRCGGTGESVHGSPPSVATSAGEVRLMSVTSTGMSGKMTLARVISGQFEFPQQNVRASFSFVVTYSDRP